MANSGNAPARIGRLTRPREFEALRRGKRIEARFGRVQGAVRRGPVGQEAATAEPALRFGLIVPKRLGDAPRRNRIKRRLREGLRVAEHSGRFADAPPAGWSADIGIYPSGAAAAMSFEALVAELGASVARLMRKLERLPI